MRMFRTLFLFSLILLPTLVISLQMNFHLTDTSCDQTLYHHCLKVRATESRKRHDPRQILTYCLTECPPQSNTDDPIMDHPSKFTFHQLAQRNITSQQLYLWSAPIDLVEKYQHYLNQRDLTQDHQINDDVFYNCTWPQFGPLCQYSFDHLSYESSPLSTLNELVYDFYTNHPYEPTTLTCYEHLKCNRAPASSCLDWTEICDGKIDCIDEGVDEQHCWKLEMNTCGEDEFMCGNGQCISKTSLRDAVLPYDCLDATDERPVSLSNLLACEKTAPIFECEDTVCSNFFGYVGAPYISRCNEQRDTISRKILFSIRPDNLTDGCWLSLRCLTYYPYLEAYCHDYCDNINCTKRIIDECPDSILFSPSVPLLLGYIYLAYTKALVANLFMYFPPQYICLLHGINSIYFNINTSIQIHNVTCYDPKQLGIKYQPGSRLDWVTEHVLPLYQLFWPINPMPRGYYDFCHQKHYQCLNSSKCILHHRLLDRINDCFYGDDEQVDIIKHSIQLEGNPQFFNCPSSDVYISNRLVGDGRCQCPVIEGECADEFSDVILSRTQFFFQTVCDGFTELTPIIIDGQPMTDETDCDHWLCNNIYTRCNKIWNCRDGRDEMNCDNSFLIDCPAHHRECLSVDTNELTCLSENRINDDHVDCIGATDEGKFCRFPGQHGSVNNFYCKNEKSYVCISHRDVCDGLQNCLLNEDERFCRRSNYTAYRSLCFSTNILSMTNIEKHLCQHFTHAMKQILVFFSLVDQRTSAQLKSTNTMSSLSQSYPSQPQQPSFFYSSPCHRGLPLRVSSYSHYNHPQLFKQTTTICLCPPSFYGHFCQYQNQRIALTLQFRALSDSWQTLFAIVILLVHHDISTHETYIHSVQQITYLPMRDCQLKFHHHLLYAARPFNTSFNYSIHIHIYDKTTFTHRSTWHIPILFPFLPVYRLSLLILIPSSKDESACSKTKCGSHGRCIPYTRHRQIVQTDEPWFCQCDRGWSGRYCTYQNNCSCSSDSLCLGTLINNRSICLCPVNKFGDRCLIENNGCHQTKDGNRTACLNGGRCIPNHDDYLAGKQGKQISFTCICSKGFTGDRCEMKQTQLIFSFDTSSVNVPESMLIHFIRYHLDRRHENATTIKSIPVNQDTVIVHWSQPFHLAFIELHRHHYYLAINQKSLTSSNDIIKTKVRSSDRCPYISELFNRTILNYHPLRRIKYYHLLCQPRPSKPSLPSLISCFYDDRHLCICDLFEGRERQANCLEFNHEMKMDCMGQNGCENGAQCFQDNPTCPQTSICICPKCFYGRRCQFSMNLFSLSLDGILGSYIRPHVSYRHQPSIVQLSFVLTVIMSTLGLLNGIFTLIIFKKKKILEVGCGYFLLCSSITTLCTMVMFLLKYSFLYASQTGTITNRSFLRMQCLTMDFFLRLCLNIDQWLNVCIAIERTITTVQGIHFNKAKSQRAARWIILILLFAVMISIIYDPMHRRLIDDDNNEEHRIWCVASYPPWLRSLDSVINTCHFGIPFLVNMISALIIIWRTSRRKTNTNTYVRFRVILKTQMTEHKHLLIAPLLIVGLGIPRLIISVVSGCMKSKSSAWLSLYGYLISFLPAMLTFVLFVLPSKLFMAEFRKSMKCCVKEVMNRNTV
uniref:Low density lipoprotein receptor n=1 Tax=Philodina roseola TaxID=96448 RepID=B2L3N0_PHIRO|nr:low density lipoprotein receptor [Philodina roseola]